MKIVAVLIIAILPYVALACDDEYFRAINIKAIPVAPFQEMTYDDAMAKEKEGGLYFIKRICEEENTVSIIHRQDKKDYLKFDYFYNGEVLVKQKITYSNGEIIENGL